MNSIDTLNKLLDVLKEQGYLELAQIDEAVLVPCVLVYANAINSTAVTRNLVLTEGIVIALGECIVASTEHDPLNALPCLDEFQLDIDRYLPTRQ